MVLVVLVEVVLVWCGLGGVGVGGAVEVRGVGGLVVGVSVFWRLVVWSGGVGGVGRGGSSSPTGSAPTMQNWVGDAVKSSVNTALDYKVADAQVEQLEAQNRLLDAQSDGVKLDNWNKQFDIDNSMPEMRRSNALFQIDKLQNEINELKSRSNQQGASASSIWKDIEVKNKQIESLAAGIGETVERTKNIIADTKSKMLMLPSAAAEGRRGRLESEYLDSDVGKALFLWNLGRKDSGLSPFDAFKRR